MSEVFLTFLLFYKCRIDSIRKLQKQAFMRSLFNYLSLVHYKDLICFSYCREPMSHYNHCNTIDSLDGFLDLSLVSFV